MFVPMRVPNVLSSMFFDANGYAPVDPAAQDGWSADYPALQGIDLAARVLDVGAACIASQRVEEAIAPETRASHFDVLVGTACWCGYPQRHT